jgi:DnaJ-class molecular chaperone
LTPESAQKYQKDALELHQIIFSGASVTNNDPKGYYNTLGVSPSSRVENIKAAYRSLVKELHPDLNKGKDTTRAFQALQEAYEILCDDRKRAEYDAYGSIPPSEDGQENGTRHHIDALRCSSCGCITAPCLSG